MVLKRTKVHVYDFDLYTRSLQKLSFIGHMEVVLSIVSDIWRDICRKSNLYLLYVKTG